MSIEPDVTFGAVSLDCSSVLVSTFGHADLAAATLDVTWFDAVAATFVAGRTTALRATIQSADVTQAGALVVSTSVGQRTSCSVAAISRRLTQRM